MGRRRKERMESTKQRAEKEDPKVDGQGRWEAVF